MTIASLRRLVITVLLGAATGTLFLGAGGRFVMRVFALATSRPPTFSVGGTLGVLLAGTIAGALGSGVLIAVRRFLPANAWLRGLWFGGLCYAVASPGFRPPRLLVFALFAPVFVAYGSALVFLDARLAKSGG